MAYKLNITVFRKLLAAKMKQVYDIIDPRIGFNNKARTQYGMPYCPCFYRK